jgi:hypothetical protein
MVRTFIISVDQHLKLGELLIMIGNLLFVNFVLFLLDIFESSIGRTTTQISITCVVAVSSGVLA